MALDIIFGFLAGILTTAFVGGSINQLLSKASKSPNETVSVPASYSMTPI